MEENYFTKLNKLDVNGHTEKKNGLTYLSWAWAIAEALKLYPTLSYEVKTFNNLPYMYDENTGYMVFTNVTIDGITREMWLPVMDNNNNAMKKEAYTYKTKYGEKSVESATMFDINKTIMRCLVKNLAMFGLGLYIYAGEDLPEQTIEMITQEQKDELASMGVKFEDVCAYLKVSSINEVSKEKASDIIAKKKVKEVKKVFEVAQ